MAHLIEESGNRALVERIAANANNALVDDLAPDEELRDWLVAHGMTVAEAARIQPGYSPCWNGMGQPGPDSPQCKAYKAQQAAGDKVWAKDNAGVVAFCNGTPLGNLYRVVVLDATSARVVQAYAPLDAGTSANANVNVNDVSAGTKIEIASPVGSGHELLVVRNATQASWSVLRHRLTDEMAYVPRSDTTSLPFPSQMLEQCSRRSRVGRVSTSSVPSTRS